MPSYDIVQPSAWDAMEPTDQLVSAAKDAVVVYGSLAQRDARSRAAITAASNAAAKRVFDINLRKPFIDPELCVEHARGAWLLKVSFFLFEIHFIFVQAIGLRLTGKCFVFTAERRGATGDGELAGA
jgi:hypothetical protein